MHISTNVPEARGREVQMIAFVDADHAGDKMTNRCLIIFEYSVEMSTFGSEFSAL
jgi:hypothetical protein